MSFREYLFIYGTLKTPPFKSLLGDAIFIESATVEGKLYLVENQYPGYVEGNGLVLGEIYAIEAKQFEKLDEYEGDLYVRRKIQTSSHIACWIYEFIRKEV